MRYFILLIFFSSQMAAAKIPPAENKNLLWAFSGTSNLPADIRIKLMNENSPLYLLLKNNLTEYTHSHISGTVNRIDQELKSKARVCYPGSTAYDSRLYYSYLTPIALLPAPMVVMRKDRAEKLKDSNGAVSLNQLVKEKDFTGVVVDSRSYGTKIDNVLKAGNIKYNVLTPLGENTIRMIQNRRADFTIEFPMITDDLIESGKFNKDLVALPMSDLRDGVVLYAACSRTPEGLEVAKRIEQIIRTASETPEYRRMMLIAAPTGEPRKAFEKQMDLFIKKRKSAPTEIH
jgi:uncharacterized protein (TIGR02285 family)